MPPKYEDWNRVPKKKINQNPGKVCKTQLSLKSFGMPPKYEG